MTQTIKTAWRKVQKCNIKKFKQIYQISRSQAIEKLRYHKTLSFATKYKTKD
jgi:hypothetical protein